MKGNNEMITAYPNIEPQKAGLACFQFGPHFLAETLVSTPDQEENVADGKHDLKSKIWAVAVARC